MQTTSSTQPRLPEDHPTTRRLMLLSDQLHQDRQNGVKRNQTSDATKKMAADFLDADPHAAHWEKGLQELARLAVSRGLSNKQRSLLYSFAIGKMQNGKMEHCNELDRIRIRHERQEMVADSKRTTNKTDPMKTSS